jgi:hypothetical protein
MQPEVQLVTDCDPTSWKRQDDGCRIVMVLNQSINKPTTGLFAILERHALSFRSLGVRLLH